MITPTQQKLIDAQLAPARVRQEITSTLARKSLDAAKAQGAAALELLGGAAQVSSGDPLVAKATGLGNLIDVTA